MRWTPIKKAYDAVALFALLNMAALTGLIVFLAMGGGLDGEKIQKMADVLRGQEAPDPGAVDATDERTVEPKPAPDQRKTDAVLSPMDLEIMRREADRIKEELRQRLALNNSIMLRVTSEREAFQQEREAELRRSQAMEQARKAEGFEKQVAILQAMKPKVAMQHLLASNDLDDAARLLLEMSTRQAKKIVESAKTERQRQQMVTIVQRIREVSPEGPGALDENLLEKQP